jgi:hypothetical protein
MVSARPPSSAPSLPPPDPAIYTSIVEVETAQELADACWNLTSNTAILVAPGTYQLDDVDFPNGVDGRLTVGRFGATPISNVQIRGLTGNPSDVVLLGGGMLDTAVPFGFQLFTVTDVLIADLSIGNVYYHAVMIDGGQGASRVRLYHLRLFDAGQQIVKGSGDGADQVTVEYSELFYTDGAIEHPQGSPPNTCYTNGVDATGGDDWIVRDNLFRRIRCQDGALAGPAVLLWQGSSGSVVEGNTFLESSRGISLGLVGNDHQGGVVRNNLVRWDPDADYAVDVGIYVASAGAKVAHNTVLTRGQYANAIEVRFSSTTGVSVENNLLDAAAALRDGGTATLLGNVTTAQPTWFVDEPAGNLRLLPTAAAAIDQVTVSGAAPTDFDGLTRPAQPGRADVGASELEAQRLFEDDFEIGDTSSWSSSAPGPP